VRAFLKKHEFGNAGWEDLVAEFEDASKENLKEWAEVWVKRPGLFTIKPLIIWSPSLQPYYLSTDVRDGLDERVPSMMRTKALVIDTSGKRSEHTLTITPRTDPVTKEFRNRDNVRLTEFPMFVLPNYGDYGYGIFLLDEKSRDHVLKNIQNEKDPFLRAMMWGALWDSVREGELDPRVFVELVVKVLGSSSAGKENHPVAAAATPLLRKEGSPSQEDESTIATLLGRTGTALNYYISVPPAVAGGALSVGSVKTPPATAGGTDKTADLRSRVEDLLMERMRTAPTLGQRITFYRAFLNIAASEKARGVLKNLLATGGNPSGSEGAPQSKDPSGTLPTGRVTAPAATIPLKAKDKFDIVARLLILGDPDAPKLLADLEKTETSDDAKRYAYAARAGIGTAENKANYWNDFVSNKEISESWIEAAFVPWNSIRHSDLTLPYLERALKELPNHKRNRKIFFVNGWLGAFIGGQRSAEALAIVNKFLADNPGLDNDLRLKILENIDLIERAVNIRRKFPQV
jgi:aminopeptidase N